MARERPILFSGEMVRALLVRCKTQTRRVVKPQPKADCLGYMTVVGGAQQCGPDYPDGDDDFVLCPYGQVGDRLWVRETFCDTAIYAPINKLKVTRYQYAADGRKSGWAYKPSIFMPRAASRLTLEITDVSVERVQAISEADACAEGFGYPITRDCKVPKFRATWDRLNAKRGYGWDANPWIWVLTFKVLDNG